MKLDEPLRHFLKESGFKILAMARLSQCEYSVCLYLLNCAVSGLDQFITTEAELASLIGYSESDLRETLEELASKNIIRVHYGESKPTDRSNPSLRIGLQYDLSQWVLAYEEEISSEDAVIFPFRRQDGANLHLLENKKPEVNKNDDQIPTWKRVMQSYVSGRSLDDEEIDLAEEAAKMLVATHPVDQVLLMLRHFGLRIPTLSLLASSWQHYQEIYEDETQKVDLSDARQKHQQLDQRVREGATSLLAKSDDMELREEEITVLQVLAKHRHPRRQLFWAYQLRSRYPNLESFFADHVSMMLAVTTGGTVVRKHD